RFTPWFFLRQLVRLPLASFPDQSARGGAVGHNPIGQILWSRVLNAVRYLEPVDLRPRPDMRTECKPIRIVEGTTGNRPLPRSALGRQPHAASARRAECKPQPATALI